MKLRLISGMMALLCLTAFAPAPFPRARPNRQSEITLQTFQGTWRITGWERADGHKEPVNTATHIRISGDRWAFVPDNYNGSTLFLAMDDSKKPAHLTFYDLADPQKSKIYGVGLIRRQGSKVQVL